MDKAHLAPFGIIERYQKPRRLGKKEPHVRSTVITRWDIILPIIGDSITKMPQLRNRIQELVNQRDKEIPVTRGEYDQLGALLDIISEAWASFVKESKVAIKERLETWYQGSRRGLFRLLVLMAGVVMENRGTRSGNDLESKGLGGMIKKAIKQVSNGSMEAKPGSLYVAINDFASGGLISNYDLEANGLVKVTQKGKSFILGAIDVLRPYFDLLSKVGLLGILKQELVIESKNINDAILDMATPALDFVETTRSIATLQSMENAIDASLAFKDARKVDVKVDIESWQDNLNRSVIDLFVLGSLMARPTYGNALITEAETALGIPTGTLYPKLRDFHERGLILPITDIERLSILNKAAPKSQGPQKVFYDITSRGTLYLLAITSLYFADLNVFLKFTQNLMECVVEPVPSTKSK